MFHGMLFYVQVVKFLQNLILFLQVLAEFNLLPSKIIADIVIKKKKKMKYKWIQDHVYKWIQSLQGTPYIPH